MCGIAGIMTAAGAKASATATAANSVDLISLFFIVCLVLVTTINADKFPGSMLQKNRPMQAGYQAPSVNCSTMFRATSSVSSGMA